MPNQPRLVRDNILFVFHQIILFFDDVSPQSLKRIQHDTVLSPPANDGMHPARVICAVVPMLRMQLTMYGVGVRVGHNKPRLNKERIEVCLQSVEKTH